MHSTPSTRSNTVDDFVEEGGYRIGRNSWVALNVSWPFGSIALSSGELTLDCITRCLKFPAAAVTRVSLYHGVFSVGIRIEHAISEYPRFVVFWMRRPEELLQRLAAAGYPVA
jgi:hypothetical protein